MDGSPRTVLLVDADLSVLQGLGDALRMEGYEVMAAGSFEAGKRFWVHHHPDVLVVDVRLGEFNGLQLLMRARADRPDLQAIITCPFPDRVLEAEARRFGGAFLVKPIDPNHIVAAIGKSKAFQELDPQRRGERRQAVIPGFWPERRSGERRKASDVPS